LRNQGALHQITDRGLEISVDDMTEIGTLECRLSSRLCGP